MHQVWGLRPSLPLWCDVLGSRWRQAHEMHHLDKALEAFRKVGKKYDILGKTKAEIVEMYGL